MSTVKHDAEKWEPHERLPEHYRITCRCGWTNRRHEWDYIAFGQWETHVRRDAIRARQARRAANIRANVQLALIPAGGAS